MFYLCSLSVYKNAYLGIIGDQKKIWGFSDNGLGIKIITLGFLIDLKKYQQTHLKIKIKIVQFELSHFSSQHFSGSITFLQSGYTVNKNYDSL